MSPVQEERHGYVSEEERGKGGSLETSVNKKECAGFTCMSGKKEKGGEGRDLASLQDGSGEKKPAVKKLGAGRTMPRRRLPEEKKKNKNPCAKKKKKRKKKKKKKNPRPPHLPSEFPLEKKRKGEEALALRIKPEKRKRTCLPDHEGRLLSCTAPSLRSRGKGKEESPACPCPPPTRAGA